MAWRKEGINMALRNMNNIINGTRGKIPEYYDMTMQEILDMMHPLNSAYLTTEEKDQLIHMIINSFRYGFALGCRATIAGKVKQKL